MFYIFCLPMVYGCFFGYIVHFRILNCVLIHKTFLYFGDPGDTFMVQHMRWPSMTFTRIMKVLRVFICDKNTFRERVHFTIYEGAIWYRSAVWMYTITVQTKKYTRRLLHAFRFCPSLQKVIRYKCDIWYIPITLAWHSIYLRYVYGFIYNICFFPFSCCWLIFHSSTLLVTLVILVWFSVSQVHHMASYITWVKCDYDWKPLSWDEHMALCW
jgi:hypothetical protein